MNMSTIHDVPFLLILIYHTYWILKAAQQQINFLHISLFKPVLKCRVIGSAMQNTKEMQYMHWKVNDIVANPSARNLATSIIQ
jgi:hypothetical protein